MFGLKSFFFGDDNNTNDKKQSQSEQLSLAAKGDLNAHEARIAAMQSAYEYNKQVEADSKSCIENFLNTHRYFVTDVFEKVNDGIKQQCERQKGSMDIDIVIEQDIDSDTHVWVTDSGNERKTEIMLGHKVLYKKHSYLEDDKFFELPTLTQQEQCIDLLIDRIKEKYKALGYVLEIQQHVGPIANAETRRFILRNRITLNWGDSTDFNEKVKEVKELEQIEAVKDGVPFADVMA